jgi:hypothetical protein
MRDPRLDELKSADPEVRADAREELLTDMDDAIADGFLEVAASDADPEIRGDAIIGLGPILEECGDDYVDGEVAPDADMGTPLTFEAFERAKAKLKALYDDESQPKLVRRRAFESLVRDPQPWHRKDIRRHADSGDADWLRTAVFCMGYFDGFDDDILKMLDHSDHELVYEAVRAAGAREIHKAAPRLRELASSSPDRDVKLEAIAALAYADPDADEFLEELSDTDDEEVADAADAARDELLMMASSGFDDDFDEEDDEEEIEEEVEDEEES